MIIALWTAPLTKRRTRGHLGRNTVSIAFCCEAKRKPIAPLTFVASSSRHSSQGRLDDAGGGKNLAGAQYGLAALLGEP